MLNDALNGKDYNPDLVKEIEEKIIESNKKLDLLLDIDK